MTDSGDRYIVAARELREHLALQEERVRKIFGDSEPMTPREYASNRLRDMGRERCIRVQHIDGHWYGWIDGQWVKV